MRFWVRFSAVPWSQICLSMRMNWSITDETKGVGWGGISFHLIKVSECCFISLCQVLSSSLLHGFSRLV